ncbi:von Willebrand factor type A domain-containing protein [Myxococcus sp. K15C18031901]|uniref:vWA domain-containing protein n=1 Tax=Myxococcus dinghuensis TaxID=2906761 RepID=UPI0020A80804|nr:von Willebrand factor type A domain-containing protein [Myxococcus dinghuensis]MCP3099531.1 von Willebrand factor type A domain-containing protein [Myxococcus dinghuensis]
MSQTFLKRRMTVWGSTLLFIGSACTSQAPMAVGENRTRAAPVSVATAPSGAQGEAALDDVDTETQPDPSVEEKAAAKAEGERAVGRVAPPASPAPMKAAPMTRAAAPSAAGTPMMQLQPMQELASPKDLSRKKAMDGAFADTSDVGGAEGGGNTFEAWKPNTFTETAKDPLSTFAADVDTASYTVARRYLVQGNLPPGSSVRVEEFVNYFKYRYAPPEKGAFTVHLEAAPSPFNTKRHFMRVGVQGKVVSRSQRKVAHLVFLVDTSGSMASSDKLPLAKEAIKIAVKNLNENDTVAIVTYAGSTRDVLPPTPATDIKRIHAALDMLEAGGGTSMGTGMELAYRHAVKKAAGGVVSRVVVLTDGDTNIGPNLSPQSMLESIHKYVAEGVTLTTVGFGMGNYRDDLMEKLADKGNGNCFYVDSYKEARKVFETQLTGTLEVIAKDVKLQVEFNPVAVKRYRLLGYENRDVADRDFRNDKVDAGEIGAGHNVTALYEVELERETNAPLATVRVRAKAPNGTEASEQAFAFERAKLRESLEAASPDFRFAVAVASTADILRGNPATEGWSLMTAQKLAEGAAAGDADRLEFVKLVAQARAISGASARGR